MSCGQKYVCQYGQKVSGMLVVKWAAFQWAKPPHLSSFKFALKFSIIFWLHISLHMEFESFIWDFKCLSGCINRNSSSARLVCLKKKLEARRSFGPKLFSCRQYLWGISWIPCQEQPIMRGSSLGSCPLSCSCRTAHFTGSCYRVYGL